MKDPKYNPGLWVLFKMDEGAAFGKIKGGFFKTGEGWLYYVINASAPNAVFTVAEIDVTATSDGGAWEKQK